MVRLTTVYNFWFNFEYLWKLTGGKYMFLVRRRIAAKKRKLKMADKSKSTDTEDESTYECYENDGRSFFIQILCL